MKIFNKKSKKKREESKYLEDKIDNDLKSEDLPINQKDRLKCRYYIEFQKQNKELYNSNRIEFWRQASRYAEHKLRQNEYDT